jgi:hypothetical protein
MEVSAKTLLLDQSSKTKRPPKLRRTRRSN